MDQAAIEKALKRIFSVEDGQELGFHAKRTRQKYDYIFVKAQENGPGVWYRLTGDKENPKPAYLDPVTESSLTGTLIDIQLVDVSTEKHGVSIKVDLIFDIGKSIPVVIRSGPTTFMEGLLRPLMCVPQIHNPLTISVARAEKSDKAVFADVADPFNYLMTEKNMPRLITWENGDKPRRAEILGTFLPAVNNVRVKLGLEPITAPVDRQALQEASRQVPKPAKGLGDIEILPIPELDEVAIKAKCFEIIKALGYDQNEGERASAFFMTEVGVSRFSAMDRQEQEKALTALYRRVVNDGA